MAATAGQVGSAGSGRIPLAHSARTLPGVSCPSSVVRSTMRTAASEATTSARSSAAWAGAGGEVITRLRLLVRLPGRRVTGNTGCMLLTDRNGVTFTFDPGAPCLEL